MATEGNYINILLYLPDIDFSNNSWIAAMQHNVDLKYIFVNNDYNLQSIQEAQQQLLRFKYSLYRVYFNQVLRTI